MPKKNPTCVSQMTASYGYAVGEIGTKAPKTSLEICSLVSIGMSPVQDWPLQTVVPTQKDRRQGVDQGLVIPRLCVCIDQVLLRPQKELQ